MHPEIIDHLIRCGVKGPITGCTEIRSLIRLRDWQVPAFDTTVLHCGKAPGRALSDRTRFLINITDKIRRI